MIPKFNKLFKIGTLVKIEGHTEWYPIIEIHDTRKWIKIRGIMGSLQRGHVTQFTNLQKLSQLIRV